MASVHSYLFNSLTGLNDDKCYVSERSKQNSAYNSYLTNNFFVNNCGLNKPLEFATSMPSVFVNGGFGNSGANGCNIDSDSSLKIGTIQTNPKCKISLYSRPFATVPYLGRGPHNPVMESKLQQGDFVLNKKSCNTTSEKSHIPYSNYPLIPSLAATITNPHNLVEGVADSGWVQGGISTRSLIRDNQK